MVALHLDVLHGAGRMPSAYLSVRARRALNFFKEYLNRDTGLNDFRIGSFRKSQLQNCSTGGLLLAIPDILKETFATYSTSFYSMSTRKKIVSLGREALALVGEMMPLTQLAGKLRLYFFAEGDYEDPYSPEASREVEQKVNEAEPFKFAQKKLEPLLTRLNLIIKELVDLLEKDGQTTARGSLTLQNNWLPSAPTPTLLLLLR